MLQALAEGLFVAERPGRLFGITVPERMVAVRLSAGGLALYAPWACSPELRRALGELGTVRFVCQPNLWPAPELDGWRLAFPEAELLAPRGAPRGALGSPPTELEDEPPTGLAPDVAVHAVRGFPALGELAWCHRPSRTLLLGDLVAQVPDTGSLALRWLVRLGLAGASFGPTRDVRWLLTDRRAARKSLERLLAWDFERIVMRRGPIVATAGKEALRRAFRWLEHAEPWWSA